MYPKYKDAPPMQSIEKAQQILRQLGVCAETAVEQRMDGIFSSTLTDTEGKWSSCGKGTTEEFCLASAFGEAIEHLCNFTAYNMFLLSQEAAQYGGFEHYPDEKRISIDQLPTEAPVIFADLRRSFYISECYETTDENLCLLLKRFFKSDDLACIPFYSIKKQKTVYLPEALLYNLCGSNGGGAGNTVQEAIGHGLDEIAERYVKEQIYHRHLTPPEVPREYVQKKCPELLDVIQSIERTGRYHISVKDCSLGKEYPVVAVIMTDKEQHAYLANFGAHPQFSIGLERCLTEMFQSYESNSADMSRKRMNRWCDIDPLVIDGAKNWVSLLRDDVGFLPNSFFAGIPSWQFCEWPEYPDYSNIIGMNTQMRRFLSAAEDVYIRNNSYFDFSAFKVYIPGISTTALPFSERHLHCLELTSSIADWLPKIRTLPDAFLNDLMRNYFHPDMFMSGIAISNLKESLGYAMYAALLRYFSLQDDAVRVLSWQGTPECDCAVELLRLSNRIRDREQLLGLLRMFYSEDAVQFAACWLDEKPFAAIAEQYMTHRYHIKTKSYADDAQSYIDRLHIRLKEHMRSHPIDQNQTGAVLTTLMQCAER